MERLLQVVTRTSLNIDHYSLHTAIIERVTKAAYVKKMQYEIEGNTKTNNQLVSQLKDENFPCLMSIGIAFQVDENIKKSFSSTKTFHFLCDLIDKDLSSDLANTFYIIYK